MDIDQLSTEILWKLDRFTRGVAQKVRKKAGSKPVDAQGSKPAPEAGTAAGTPQPFNGKEDKSGHHDSSSSSSEGKSLICYLRRENVREDRPEMCGCHDSNSYLEGKFLALDLRLDSVFGGSDFYDSFGSSSDNKSLMLN